ncbi:MAG: TolC family protein [Rhizonema sp. PD37]|nr:TolC family protein [Rhizonema sp. PD37]
MPLQVSPPLLVHQPQVVLTLATHKVRFAKTKIGSPTPPIQNSNQKPDTGRKPTEHPEQSPSGNDEEQDTEQAEQESDSVLPKTPQNPFSKPDIDSIIKKQFDDDIWRIMKGALPCLETSAVCLQELQQKAVAQSPLLKEVDSRVEEANQKIDEAKARNKKSIQLSVLSPALRYLLGPAPSSDTGGKRRAGFFDRIAQLFTGNIGIVNDLLSIIGIPLFEGTQGGNSDAQSRAVQIGDLQIKVAELQRERAKLADTIREKVAVALSKCDEARTEFQTSQILAIRSVQQFQIYQIGYVNGDSDTESYLAKLNSLDRTKAQTYTSWAKMRRSLFEIKLLVLNVKEVDN